MSRISRNHRDPAYERDFRQLAGALDRPIAPAPEFAESLRRQIAGSEPTSTPKHRPATTMVIARESPVLMLADRRRRHIGFSILEIAAALLLISALALSAYIININAVGGPTGPDAGNGPGQLSRAIASPVRDASTERMTAGINWGGDKGRSQYYGSDAIDPSKPPVDLQIGDERTTTVGPGLFVGDSWYGWTVRAGADAFLRVNVATGETVWEQEYRTWGTLGSNGQRIFAFLIDASDTPTPVPVAISMTTGEIAWRGPALHPFAISITASNEGTFYLDGGTPPPAIETYAIDLTREEHGPVVAGETVYFTDGKATTVALGIDDGAERWRDDRSDDFPADFGYVDEITFPRTGTIVANERYVFVRLPDNSIVSLDPATGREIARSFRGGFVDSTRSILGMSLRGDRLVVLTISSFVSSDGSTVGNAAISVLDAGSLEVLVTSDFVEGGAGFDMVVTDSSAFLLTIGEQDVWELIEVDLTTGSLSEPFGTGLLVESIRLSGTGDTLIAAMSSGTVLYFSMETHELLDRHRVQRGQTIALVGGPMPIEDGRPIAVWKVGPNAPVPETPPATPIP